LRLDPVSGRAQAIHVSGRPDEVIVGQGGVWVASADGGLTRIDPGTNETATTDISAAAPLPMGVAVDDRGKVFVTALTCQICEPLGSVAKFDPSSGSVSVVPLPRNTGGSSIIIADGSMWITAASEVWKAHPATGKVLTKVRIEEGLGDMAADPSGSSVWVTTVGSGGRVGRAIQIDASTGEVIGGQPIGCCPGAIAIGEGYVWVTNSTEGTIQRISLTTGDVAPPITVGRGVNGIAVGLGGVWVTIDR
jgi:streptogramin lyase